ncbi:LuxR C-terminal-related transcriptional regulator [Rhizobium paknamense]|uniref:LuxR family maltose regulon positive regulatory protein n=1 Tax=Rhizobium paknamense TaxID=1206817 RepID=A0ABU0IDQ1_9HYPH|nr:LuxR C-terminal-related transcriptional regulator [Rhizobium paknamense]MDQ0455768.1 LuxR family maltose regulon positive regulatory protein [Rhizobium paknamense]
MLKRPAAEETVRPLPVIVQGADGPRFLPPRMLFQVIERPYVLSKLADGLGRQSVLLRAPAGFGKTALMKTAYDAALSGAPLLPGVAADAISHCAWTTLVPQTPPARFLSDLALALAVQLDEMPPETAGECPNRRLERILESVGRRPGLSLLFLDGIDHLDLATAPRLLEQLLTSAPENLRMACASMLPPPVPTARLKARGLLSEILAVDLVFSPSEVRRLTGEVAEDGDFDALFRITLGWPALVQLGRGILDAAQDDESRASLFDGSHADIAGFVQEAVIDRLPDCVRNLLYKVALFEEFSLPLAQVLCGNGLTDDGRDWLNALSPVIEKSRSGWFSLHPALRSQLYSHLARDGEEALRDLYRRAAAWFADQGLLERAVSHAAASGDFRMAEEIIGRAGGVDLFLRAGYKVLEELIENFPADILYSSPGLTLCYAVVEAKRGHVAGARERMDMLLDASGGWSQQALATIDRSVLDHIDALINIYEDRCLGLDDAARLQAQADSLPPHATWELGWIYNTLAIIHTRIGDLEAARSCALKALGHYREEKTAYAQVFMLVHLGLIGTLRGDFSAALQFCREAEQLAESRYWRDRNLLSIARLVAADASYLQGNVQTVEKILTEVIEPLVRGESWVELFARLFRSLAKSRLHVSGFEEAMAAIDKAEEVAVERALPRLTIAAGIMRMDLLVGVGMIESAQQAAEQVAMMKARIDPDLWTWQEAHDFEIASARLAIAQGHPQAALAALEDLIAATKQAGQGHHRLLAGIVAVRAAWKAGRQQEALAYLQWAIALARTHEATQPFIDEGQDFAATVRAVVRRFGLKAFSGDAVEFMSRIVGHGLKRPRQPENEQVQDQPQPGLLSHRETAVLKLLAEDRSNKEIARILQLSEATVKFHLKNIYAKLGVSRRTMAVSVSRRLNML